jgi:hypothetical protein
MVSLSSVYLNMLVSLFYVYLNLSIEVSDNTREGPWLQESSIGNFLFFFHVG